MQMRIKDSERRQYVFHRDNIEATRPSRLNLQDQHQSKHRRQTRATQNLLVPLSHKS
ncbi:hypothetical protein Syun_014644 [Stephania yunnanensis]|uniref:Uncharacterized protein n=1 Tax=Stephania yunnanensis TaxID=152371 RepID=A0AAP0JK16_9MAGN